MAADFDPYYKWLGIPPRDQPPNHYRLLGIELFEENRQVIEAAANRQMSYLKELSTGAEMEHAQKLLGEVSAARVCLLNTATKPAYDAQLRGELDLLPEAEEESQTPSAGDQEVAPDPASSAVPDFESSAASPRRTAKQRPATRRAVRTEPAERGGNNNLPLKIALATGSAAIVVVLLLLVMGGGEEEKKSPAENEPTKTTFAGAADADPRGLVVPKLDVPNLTEPPAKGRPSRAEPLQTTATPAEQEPPPAPEPSQSAASEIAETAVAADADQQARDLLEGKGLRESFNEWELFELTEAYQTATDGQAAGGPTATFESELQQRIEARKANLWDRVNQLQAKGKKQGKNLAPAEAREYYRIIGLLKGMGNIIGDMDDIQPIDFSEEEQIIRSDLKQQRPDLLQAPSASPELREIVESLQAEYVQLAADPDVQKALEQVAGTLAEPPDLPAVAATSGRAPTEKQTVLASTESPPAASDDQQEEVQQGSDTQAQDDSQPPEPEAAEQPSAAGKESGGGSQAESESPAARFDDLKDQLTAAQKQTVIAFSKFNKGVKEYTKGQKELLKMIKPLQGLIARLQAQLDAMRDGDKKNAFGKKIEEGPMKNLAKLQGKLAGLPKPAAAVVEAKFTAADKLVKQLQEHPQYESNRSSISALAEKIEKTKKAFGGAQRKLAKEPK